MIKRILVAATLALSAAAVQAEEFNIDISNDSFRGAVSGPLSRALSGVSGLYDVGLLYKDGNKRSAKPKDTQLTLAHLAVLATGDVGAKGTKTTAGLGARFVFADRGNTTGAALALGGQFNVRFPGFERVGLLGYGWIAPDITSFSDVKNYSEYGIDVEFEVVRAASIYGGYRRVNLKPEPNGPSNADDGAHIGLSLNF